MTATIDLWLHTDRQCQFVLYLLCYGVLLLPVDGSAHSLSFVAMLGADFAPSMNGGYCCKGFSRLYTVGSSLDIFSSSSKLAMSWPVVTLPDSTASSEDSRTRFLRIHAISTTSWNMLAACCLTVCRLACVYPTSVRLPLPLLVLNLPHRDAYRGFSRCCYCRSAHL